MIITLKFIYITCTYSFIITNNIDSVTVYFFAITTTTLFKFKVDLSMKIWNFRLTLVLTLLLIGACSDPSENSNMDDKRVKLTVIGEE